MHLIAPTQWIRTNLTKIGAVLVEADPVFALRRVRLILPNGVVAGVSLTERPGDIGNGLHVYDWPEVEGPQTNLVFHLGPTQHLAAVLSSSSPGGLAPRCSVIVEYLAAALPLEGADHG